MHGLLRCNINTGVHARAQSGRVTQRCHNSPDGKRKLESAKDVTHRKCAEDFETCLGRRRLAFACSRGPWNGVARDRVGGRWKSQNRKNVHLSPYVEEPLNSKVIKTFVPEQRSCKCFSCFEIPVFYLYGHSMYVSHIAISWLRYICFILFVAFFVLFLCRSRSNNYGLQLYTVQKCIMSALAGLFYTKVSLTIMVSNCIQYKNLSCWIILYQSKFNNYDLQLYTV